MTTPADLEYALWLEEVQMDGDEMESRNGPVKSCWYLPPVTFTQTPLITLRKTAWKKALREMEWFLSGHPECPEELRDWWAGQLNPQGEHLSGYGYQWRRFSGGYDQIQALIEALRAEPHSRRLLTTTWNPWDMSGMTAVNQNPNTPANCHGSLIQCFVRHGQLLMTHYQRSADLLLGVPHNLIQYWALLLWLAYHAGLQPGALRVILGDAHIYQEPSHRAAVEAILRADTPVSQALSSERPTLEYRPPDGIEETPTFRAADFVMHGVIAEPVTAIRPPLL